MGDSLASRSMGVSPAAASATGTTNSPVLTKNTHVDTPSPPLGPSQHPGHGGQWRLSAARAAWAAFLSRWLSLPSKSEGKYLPRPLVFEQRELLAQRGTAGYGPRPAAPGTANSGAGASPKSHITEASRSPTRVHAAPNAAGARSGPPHPPLCPLVPQLQGARIWLSLRMGRGEAAVPPSPHAPARVGRGGSGCPRSPAASWLRPGLPAPRLHPGVKGALTSLPGSQGPGPPSARPHRLVSSCRLHQGQGRGTQPHRKAAAPAPPRCQDTAGARLSPGCRGCAWCWGTRSARGSGTGGTGPWGGRSPSC